VDSHITLCLVHLTPHTFFHIIPAVIENSSGIEATIANTVTYHGNVHHVSKTDPSGLIWNRYAPAHIAGRQTAIDP